MVFEWETHGKMVFIYPMFTFCYGKSWEDYKNCIGNAGKTLGKWCLSTQNVYILLWKIMGKLWELYRKC